MITNIEDHSHLATEIDTHPADVEYLDTYEQRIGDYAANNYSYIPIPAETKYYSTEQGWLKDMDGEQIVDQDTHIMEILRKLQRQPFLLVDYLDMEEYHVFKKNGSTRAFGESFLSTLGSGTTVSITDGDFEITGEDIEGKSNNELITVHELRKEYPNIASSTLNYEYGDQYGVITIADVNKRGVKQMLYKLVSELSENLGSKIQKEYPESEEIEKYLRPVTIGRWRKDHINGLEIHISEHMNLIEMMQVIQSSSEVFVEKCGFESKGDVERLNSINNIRNQVMHANRSLIYDRKEIEDLLESIREMQNINTNIDERRDG